MGNFNRGGGFGRNRDRGGRSNFRRDDRREVTMTRVVCDGCGKSCEVPFKPTAGKPVFCNDCFRSQGGGRRDNAPRRDFNDRPQAERSNFVNNNEGGNDIKKQLEILNSKLDKLVSLIERSNTSEKDPQEKVESMIVSLPKKESKKVAKKKVAKK